MTLTPYEQQLQRSLDLMVYRDATRDYLSNTDQDILQLFSGDAKLARRALEIFHSRHRNGTWVTSDNGVYQLKVSALMEKAEQRSQKSQFRKARRNRGKRNSRRWKQ